MNMRKHVKAISGAVVLVVLSACGGGGGGGGTPATSTTIGGLAVDGYLANAKVCLDLNLNFKCDADEPSATTDDKGAYAINYTGGDAAGLVVITETTGDTKDSDDGGLSFAQANRSPFVLAAPVPVGATDDVKITPLTTVVTTNALTENVSGGRLALADIDTAVTALKATWGVDPSKDLMKLDVSKDSSLKPVAQLLAHTLGEIQKAVTENSTPKMKTAVAAAANTVTSLLEDGQLSASVITALNKPATERAAELKKIPTVQTAVASTTKVVNLGGSTMDPKQMLKDGLVIGEMSSSYNTFDANADGGIGQWKSGSFLNVEYLKYDADTKVSSNIERILDKGWVKKGNWSNEYSLTTQGTWVDTEGNPFEKAEVAFEKNCVRIRPNAAVSYIEQHCFEEKDLSNLVILEVNASYCDEAEDTATCKAAKFQAGSKGYDHTGSVIGSDAYMLWVPNRATDRAKHLGTKVGSSEVKTIPDFVNALVALKDDSGYALWVDNNFYVRLKSYDTSAKTGVFRWFYNHDNNGDTPLQDAGESTFEVKDVAGMKILVFKPSLKYLQVERGDMVGRDFIFAAKDGAIFDGAVQYKDFRIQNSLNGYLWFGNKAMLESVLSGHNLLTKYPYPFTNASDK